MKKRMLSWLTVLMVCCILAGSLPVHAAVLDPERACSLTLHYTRGETAFEGLDVKVYRVAQAERDGSFELIEPYADYPVNIQGVTSQLQWNNIAATLSGYVTADRLPADGVGTTDRDGKVVLSGLETGLYLVKEVVAQKDNTTYVFQDFMIYLPTPQKDGSYAYHMQASPKSGILNQQQEYRVVKMWQGQDNPQYRPAQVRIDILHNGALWSSVTLSEENDWAYTWTVSNDDGNWTVVERDVVSGYEVTVVARENVFVILNTWNPDTPDNPNDPDDPGTPDNPNDPGDPDTPGNPNDPDDPGTPDNPDDPGDPDTPDTPDHPDTPDPPKSDVPKTGDTAPLWLYIAGMCGSGLMLMMLGAIGMRGKAHEKRR